MSPTVAGGKPPTPILIHRVITRLNVGGPSMHVVNLAKGLDDTGLFRTRLVAGMPSDAEGDMEYYARERGVSVERIRTLRREVRPKDDLAAIQALYRLFRRERPAIVHTHMAKAGALGRQAAALARVPVRVHTYHGHVLGGGYFSPRMTRVFLEVERWLARLTHRLIVLSRFQAHEMQTKLRIAGKNRFEIVSLGLELDPFLAVDRNQAREQIRSELSLRNDDYVIGIVGRLTAIKNHELLFDAIPRVRALTGKSPRILIVGSGEREAELRRYAEDRGIFRDILWLGWRKELAQLYSAMDVLALTSHDEGTPVAVIEALTAGAPIVATGVGGVPEVLEDGRFGRIVRPGEAGDLAIALADVFLDKGPLPLSLESRTEVARQYSVGRLLTNLASLYQAELLKVGYKI